MNKAKPWFQRESQSCNLMTKESTVCESGCVRYRLGCVIDDREMAECATMPDCYKAKRKSLALECLEFILFLIMSFYSGRLFQARWS